MGLLSPIRRKIEPKDKYGKEVDLPLPLTFKQVNEERLPTSKILLFRLPYEIISIVFSHIDNSSLASLAQVDRDCRQLARSHQFSNIVLDYSDNSFQLLQTLLKEAIRRCQNKRLTTQPSIGACVRRITVSTNPEWLTQHHKIEESVGFNLSDEEVKMMRFKDAATSYYDGYLKAIKTLLESPFALPHLELLHWRDGALLSLDFFNCFAKSKVQHLKLHRLQISEEFELEPRDSLNL